MSSYLLQRGSCNVTTKNVTTGFMLSKGVWRGFGDFLKQIREEKKLSQEGASRIVGLSRQQWNRLESGESQTTRKTAEQIAERLNLNVEEVLLKAGFLSFGGKSLTVKEITDEEFQMLILASEEWTEENRQDALELAKAVYKQFAEKEKRLKKD